MVSTLEGEHQPPGNTSEQRVDDGYTVFPHPQRLSPWYNDFSPIRTGDNHQYSTMRIKTSVLCSKCAQIRAWLAQNWARLNIVNQTFEHTFNHYDDSRHLKQSASGGCHLCTLFLHNFDRKIVHSQTVRVADRGKALSEITYGRQVRITAYNKGASGCVLLPLLIVPNSKPISGGTTPLRPVSYFRPTQKEDLFVSLSSTNVSTTSVAAANLAKKWIADCTKSHQKCAKSKSSSLPTRLVDVRSLSKAGKVRLLETQSIPSDSGIQYTALSYCWGLTPTFKLTKSTWEALSSGVAIKILPRTMRDAINFTRDINVDWLWIDSLCIFQDSQEDWNREALTMRQVYRDAFLVIAALGAASGDEGLFAIRDPLLYSPCFLFQTEQGEDIHGGQDSTLGLVMDAWPLHQRGWVVQERILASRTLNFGPYLIWQCQEKLADEYDILARNRRGFNTYKRFSDLVIDGGTYDMTSTERDEAILDSWTGIALDYTSGILSVASDRLITISGIISAIRRRTGWTNLAGLWKPFLWRQVLWEKAFDAAPESRECTGLQPTWSWTAITGGVIWSNDEPDEGFFMNAIADVQHTDDIIPSQTKLNSCSDPRMALQVSCIPARIGTISAFNGIARYRANLAEFPLSGEGFFEPDAFVLTRRPELFLPIGAGCWNDESLLVYGLAVVSSQSCVGAFERVGFFTFYVKEEKNGGNSTDYDYAVLQELSSRKEFILV